jgi:hypothetical protein
MFKRVSPSSGSSSGAGSCIHKKYFHHIATADNISKKQ